MSRIRTIKPEFFRHEDLQDLEAQHGKLKPMLTFAGLWTLADRNGVFEWRPRQIKLDILPFLNFSMDETLTLLQEYGFIQHFTRDGKDYGFIPTFGEHQRFTGKEAQAPGKYPEPTREDLETQEGSTGETPEKQPGNNQEAPGNPGMEYGVWNMENGVRSIASDDEKNHPPPPAPVPVISIPLNNKTEHPIYQDQIDEWTTLFPGIDVLQELRNIRAWNLAEPTRRKTASGIGRHITGWLAREQNRGAKPQGTAIRKPQSKEQPATVYRDYEGDPDIEEFKNMTEAQRQENAKKVREIIAGL